MDRSHSVGKVQFRVVEEIGSSKGESYHSPSLEDRSYTKSNNPISVKESPNPKATTHSPDLPQSTVEVELQPWPPKPKHLGEDYELVQRWIALSEAATALRTDIDTVVAGSYALLLSIMCGSQAVEFGFHYLRNKDERMESNGTVIAIDVDRKLKLEEYLHIVDMHGIPQIPENSADTSSKNTPHTTVLCYGAHVDLLTFNSMSFWKERNIRFSICCSEVDGKLSIQAFYNRHSLSDGAVVAFLEQFENITKHIYVSDPTKQLHSVPILQSKALVELTERAGPSLISVEDIIPNRLERAVRTWSNKMAIEAWDGHMSYMELWKASGQMAEILGQAGLSHGLTVPVCMQKTKMYPVTMLAILRLGAAFVPLDPSQPMARLSSIIQQLTSKLVLISSDLQDRWSSTSDKTLIVDRLDLDRSSSIALPLPVIAPESLAYIIFTSGSTGEPKGVQVEHRNFLSGALARATAIQRDEKSRVFQFSSHAFDATIEDILTTILCGGTVCIPSETEKQTDIEGAINKYNANAMDTTPALAKIMTPTSLPTLRTLIVGGEAMTAAVIKRWGHHLSLINTYGPSECAIVSTATEPLKEGVNHLSIGKCYGCKPWVVDLYDGSTLVPLGALGELVLEGPIVGRGYLNDPDKTEAAFGRPLSWLDRNSRIYRTGDLARLTEHGEIEYFGRKDSMVKLNGQRIELAEIESHTTVDFITGDFAIEVGSDGDEDFLILFFTSTQPELRNNKATPLHLSREESEACQRLKDRLLKTLPSYMIPGVFIPLSCLPTNTSDKIDRKRLRQLVATIPRDEFVHYRLYRRMEALEDSNLNSNEQKLRDIWAKVLKVPVERVNAGSNFVAMGGNSIRAIHLAASLKKLHSSISVPEIFRSSDLRQMAAQLSARVARKEEEAPRPFSLVKNPDKIKQECIFSGICSTPNEIEDAYPCTPFQEAVISASALRHGAYTMRGISSLDRNTDVARFQSAWSTVVATSPILRTIVVLTEDEGSIQVVLKQSQPWRSHTSVEKYIETDKTQPMGYSTPLLRLCVVQSEDSTHFVITIHHAIYDLASLTEIFKRVDIAYQNQSIPPQAQSKLSFSRFLRHIKKIDNEKCEDFWRHELAGAPTSQFLPNEGLKKEQSRCDRVLERTMTFKQTHVDDRGITLAVRARAAWALTMGCYASSNDVVFGATSSGRSDVTLDGILEIPGPTITTTPVRVAIDEDMMVTQFLQQLQQQSSRTIPYEQFGMYNISRLHPEACSFDSILNITTGYKLESDEAQLLPFNDLENLDSTRFTEDFYVHQLNMDVHMTGTNIKMVATFNQDYLAHWRMKSILNTFAHILTQLNLCGSESQLRDIKVCSPEDAAQIQAWNSEILSEEMHMVHDLFSNRSRLNSEAEAVHAWDGTYTYSQLEDYSTRLAVYLQHITKTRLHKDQPPMVIPLCFEKSAFMVIAVLAVLKAGFAYAALDVNNPDHRLTDMCAQIDAELILCGAAQSDRLAKLPLQTVQIDLSLLKSLPVRNTFDRSEKEAVSRTPNQPAFVVFTSGSTGTPKPIVISHRALCTCAREFGPRLGFDSSVRVLQNASYAFDIHACEIFFTLIFGGILFLTKADRSELPNMVKQWNINWLFMTPSATEAITGPHDIPSVRTLMMIGEAPNRAQIAKLKTPTLTLINAYGPAENTLFTSSNTIENKLVDPQLIGAGINTHTWITDPNDPNKLMPIGALGELLLEGPQLADGYINRKLETDKAFIQCPKWTEFPHAIDALDKIGKETRRTLYRTGDLVHYVEDGSLRIVGRIGSQIKLRGQRLELEEVEHHLRQAVNLETVAVNVFTNSKGRKFLAAFVLNEGVHSSKSEDWIMPMNEDQRMLFTRAKTELEGRLPFFMIPTLFIGVSCMPKTLSGKLNRTALKARLDSMSDQDAKLFSLDEKIKEQPTKTAELLLQSSWAELLNIPAEEIAVDDSFFSHGGDSILAIKLVALVNRNVQAGLSLAVSDVLRYPKLRDMANAMQTIDNSKNMELQAFSLVNEDSVTLVDHVSTMLHITKDQIQDAYPCSSLQEAFFASSARDPVTYVARHSFSLPLDVDVSRFRAAWSKTVNDLDILRTRVVTTQSGGLVQVVLLKSPSSAFTIEKVTSIPPVAVTIGSELHAAYIKLDKDSRNTEFIWEVSHILFDAWSVSLVMKHLEAIYFSSELPLTTQYRYYIQHLQTIDQDAARAFWSAHLNSGLAVDFPRQSIAKLESRRMLTTSMQTVKMPQSADTTMAVLLEAAWAFLLARKHLVQDVLYAMTLSGRNSSLTDIHSVVGPTICTVPRRTSIRLNESVSQLLEQVRSSNLESLPFEHLGFQNILQMTSKSQFAKPQNILVIQNEGQEACELLEPVYTPDTADYNDCPLLLELSIGDCPEEQKKLIRAECSFESSLIHEEDVQAMMRQLFFIANNMEDVNSSLGDIQSRLTDEENHLSSVDVFEKVAPSCDLIQNAISENFDKAPGKIAIHELDSETTYGELHQAVMSLTNHLRSRFPNQAQTVVALYLRSPRWSTIATIATLYSGLICLHVDPESTLADLLPILQENQVSLILTDASCVLALQNHLPTLAVNDSGLAEISIKPISKQPLHGLLSSEWSLRFCFSSATFQEAKTMEITLEELNNWYHMMIRDLSISSEERILLDPANGIIRNCVDGLLTLATGACICMPSTSSEPHKIETSIASMRPTVLFQPPSKARRFPSASYSGLSKLILFGESPRRSDIQEFESSGLSLHSMYCPPIWPLGLSITKLVAGNNHTYLGQPGFNTVVCDISDVSRRQPRGWLGFLAVKNPKPYTGYFNTDDLVIRTVDGKLLMVDEGPYHSTVDNQYLPIQQIESAVMEYLPEITDCKAEICRVELLGDTRLILFLDAESDRTKPGLIESRPEFAMEWIGRTIPRLKQILTSKLPNLTVTPICLLLRSMPRNSSGCIDRMALHSLANALSSDSIELFNSSPVKKLTDKEQVLASLWAKILDVDVSFIHPDSRWVTLGGDSISAMRLTSLARRSGYKVTVADILSSGTLSGTAEALQAAKAPRRKQKDSLPLQDNHQSGLSTLYSTAGLKEQIDRLFKLDGCTIEDLGEITDYQTTMFCSGTKSERGWQNYLCVDLSSKTPGEVIERACNSLMMAYPIFRTIFIPFKGKVMQAVLSQPRLEVHTQQCTDVATGTRAWIEADRKLPPVLTTGVIRGTILRGSDNTCRLILVLHHVLYDGISLSVLGRELNHALVGDSITPPTNTFVEYVMAANGSFDANAQAFWRKHLLGSRMTNLVRHERPLFQQSMNSSYKQEIDLPNSPSQNHTIATVVKAAWALVLSQWAKTDDVTFGVLMSGRNPSDQSFAEMNGPCVNIIPFRLRLDADTSEGILQQVHEQHVATLPYEACGYHRIISQCTDWLPWTRFSSIVYHQNYDPADSRMSIIPTKTDSADLSISTEVNGEKLALELIYSDSVFSSNTIKTLASYLSRTLDALLHANANAIISQHMPYRQDMRTSLPSLPIQLLPNASQSVANGGLEEVRTADLGDHDEAYEIVRRAWRSVGLDATTGANTTFYEKDGSLVYALELAQILSRMCPEPITVDEILTAPSVQEQVLLVQKRLD